MFNYSYNVPFEIPFCGFYNTLLGSMIENEEENFGYSYIENNGKSFEGSIEWNYNALFNKVSAYHTSLVNDRIKELLQDYFNEKIESDLFTFESLQRPKEYNFETDRIFIKATPLFWQYFWQVMDKNNYIEAKKLIQEKCTHKSGFFSFYPTDFYSSKWLDRIKNNTLEPAQLALLFEAFYNALINRLPYPVDSIFEECEEKTLEYFTCNYDISEFYEVTY